MSDINKLYSPLIRQHNDQPYHFERVESAPFHIKAINPVCGDRFELFVDLKDGQINSLHFHGMGCAVAKASGSMLVMSLEGMNTKDARVHCIDFLDFLQAPKASGERPLKEDWTAFGGVHDFPERMDCAALVWREMLVFLEQQIEKDKHP